MSHLGRDSHLFEGLLQELSCLRIVLHHQQLTVERPTEFGLFVLEFFERLNFKRFGQPSGQFYIEAFRLLVDHTCDDDRDSI